MKLPERCPRCDAPVVALAWLGHGLYGCVFCGEELGTDEEFAALELALDRAEKAKWN